MGKAKRSKSSLSRVERAGFFLIAVMPILVIADLIPIFQVNSLNIRPTDFVFVPAFILCTFHILFQMRAPKGFATYILYTTLLGLTLSMGVLLCGNLVDWHNYGRLFQTILWGALALVYIRTERQLQIYGDMIILCSTFASAVSLYYFIQNPEMQRVAAYFSEIDNSPDVPGGVNGFAAYYVLALTILIWRTYYEGWSLRTITGLTLSSIGLLLVQSRSAFLSFGLIMLGFMLLWIRKMMRDGVDWRPIGFFAIVLIGFVIGSSFLPVNRIKLSFIPSSSEATSTEDRYIGWRNSRQMAVDAGVARLILGYGNTRFSELTNTPTSESFYFDHGISEGLLGLGFILSILLTPIVRLWPNGRSDRFVILAFAVTLNALIISITGNVLVSAVAGGTSLSVLYGIVSVHRRPETPSTAP